jgi:DNA/RNA non-specific endonuclease
MPRFTVTLVPADSTGSTYDEVWDFTWTHEYELIPNTTDHRVTGIEGPAGLVDDGWLRVRSVVPLCVQNDTDSWVQYKEGGYEGGHLIGRAFGGPDTEFNLVPMNAAVNKGGDWKVWENTVAAALKKNNVYYRQNRRASSSDPHPARAFDPSAFPRGKKPSSAAGRLSPCPRISTS